MSVRSFAAARLICQQGNWQVTNLALQKVLYVAHMIYLGRTGEGLIKPAFEAWDYGPVLPKLYRRVRSFGSEPIQDVFSTEASIKNRPEGKIIAQVCDVMLKLTPGQLVAFTHEKGGAWERNYVPGVRGIEIPTEHILDEYRTRKAATKSAA